VACPPTAHEQDRQLHTVQRQGLAKLEVYTCTVVRQWHGTIQLQVVGIHGGDSMPVIRPGLTVPAGHTGPVESLNDYDDRQFLKERTADGYQ
jgi:hypothetical protein